MNVCVKNLDDFQLAVALARVVENGDDGPILQGLLKDTVVPIAFRDGNRWLASWAFWLLHRRDLAVRILLVRARIYPSEASIDDNLRRLLSGTSLLSLIYESRTSETRITTTLVWPYSSRN